MNKEQKQIKKRIDQAYSKLHVLSNITWTPYRDEIFDMNKKDEKRHRFNRPSSDFEASINDMIDYLEDNQNKIDNEIKDDQKAKKIFQQIEDLKNDLYEFIEVKGDK